MYKKLVLIIILCLISMITTANRDRVYTLRYEKILQWSVPFQFNLCAICGNTLSACKKTTALQIDIPIQNIQAIIPRAVRSIYNEWYWDENYWEWREWYYSDEEVQLPWTIVQWNNSIII